MTSRLKMKRIHKEVTVHGSWGLCRLVRLRAAYTAFPVPVSDISTSKPVSYTHLVDFIDEEHLISA